MFDDHWVRDPPTELTVAKASVLLLRARDSAAQERCLMPGERRASDEESGITLETLMPRIEQCCLKYVTPQLCDDASADSNINSPHYAGI
jgi:hypothetical protein